MIWSRLTGTLETAKALDPVAERVSGVLQRVLPRGALKNALHGTWLGHQLHPLLVAGPIGLWTSAILLDQSGGDRHAARRLVGAGLLTVAPTALSGLADWSELGSAKRPTRVGLVHALANSATTALFGASWLARRAGREPLGRGLALLGAGGLAVGGYLGGHLSYAQAVGVNRNADEPKKPREWTDAVAAASLVEGTPHAVEVDGQQIVLVRSADRVHAIGGTCGHWGAPLTEGTLVEGGTCLECPWHGSRFRLADGSVARGPATTAQLSYEVRVVGDRVEVRVRG